MRILIYILLFLIWNAEAFGQDVHWSQFDHNPVFQNPANVGRFDGDYRFHANYKDQWRNVTVPFQTLSISAEAKQIYKGFNLGGYILNDVAGDGSFRTIEFQPSISYTYKLTADSTHLLRPGLQLGVNFRSINASAFTFDNQWNGYQFDGSLDTKETFQSQKKTNFSFGIGMAYEFQKSKRERIVTGIGLFNINRPNQSFLGEEVKRDMRFNLFTQAEYAIGFDWDILPSIQLNLQGKYRELILGSQVRYILEDRLGEYKAVMAGLYMRSNDAFYISAGMEYQNYWGGISYDINTSDLTPASRSRGGLELSFRYILHSFKPKNIIHRVCPDFI
ncbi:PorP/SprF family type IX secretion system membrane protein [Brumimicrobium aurantiacum]|uniref:Type IX secretion system membrane protein PorP/SprF n=1 Tax=Brumimicrobium aurantiacum TaxID=1737063 RepID=A0A3E1EVU1_9FLAO|nr:PorP/SprF family type IX secretion system membrane protein [Brumimicrobium aurantiacum]RFC53671.1 type IX secretion system membrane protein PorP/SprF [Brumimicrobium aurantiacum]